ncbi:DNA repair protein RecO [Candidatus Peregrinibacteria bacterium]|nr:DNA repair protein RecO [Candidatus Peregrinibacteria bacterium]
MKTATTRCIILGHKDFGESDKIIYLYSEELGKIRAIAKGARKITSRFTGHLETLNICTASLYFGPKNIILREISTEKNFFKLRKSLKTISNSLQIAEITNHMLFENKTLDKLIELLENTINHIQTSRKKSLIKTAYLIKLSDKAGMIPDFKQTKIPTGLKYSKFFNFIKNKPYKEIEKISLTKRETKNIKKITNELLQDF